MEQPVFLSGKVVMEDGSAVPEPVPVDLVCSGQVRMRVYSTMRGDFSLTLGSNRPTGMLDADIAGSGSDIFGPRSGDVFGDRSMSGGIFSGDRGRVDLSACELRASLPGFQSNTVALGIRRVLDKPDVGLIVLQRLAKVQGTTVSFTTLAAPEKARKAYEKGKKELEKKTPDHAKAARELENAIREYEAFATAWNLLGRVRLALQDKAGAREAFTKSVSADSKYIDPYIYLAMLEMEEGRWAETARLAEQVQELNPYITHAHYLSAISNYQLGQLDLAEKFARQVQSSNEAKRYPVSHYILGAIQARRGDYASAASEFRLFLETKPDPNTSAAVHKMLAEWEQQGHVKKE